MSRRALLAVCGLLALVAAATAVATTLLEDGRIGPDRRVLNTGQRLEPFGKRIGLGQFPTGGAVTPNGRYYWAVATGRGIHDVRILSVRSGRLLQTLRIPGASGGIAMDPSSSKVYVSGVADPKGRKLQQTDPGTPGRSGDVIHVYTYNPRTGSAKEAGLLKVPTPSARRPPRTSRPPTSARSSRGRTGWP